MDFIDHKVLRYKMARIEFIKSDILLLRKCLREAEEELEQLLKENSKMIENFGKV